MFTAVANQIRSFAQRFSQPTAKPSSAPTTTVSNELASIGRRRRSEINASYDASRDGEDNQNYWANADFLDADSAHSRAVRSKLVSRSRYEAGNNPFADGIGQTYCNDLVGYGPKLRMETENPGFNQAVEKDFARWCKAIGWRRKLWCMAHAKHVDGEGFGVLRTNPSVPHPVKLDVQLVETEQCQSPSLAFGQAGYIDGIKFDQFGNPQSYDILPHHPGGGFSFFDGGEPDQVPAKYVLHWFKMRRPGQHRGVPETASSLNTGASARRWREATLAAAETAADFAAVLHTNLLPDETQGATKVAPMSTFDIAKRQYTSLPMGWEMDQLEAKHPNATYESFNKSLINEQARPKNMPFNVAACDSSDYNYASGRLDYLIYHAGLDVDRADGDDLVLDKLFAAYFHEAALVYGWEDYQEFGPPHAWDWPKHPVADRKAEADADLVRMKSGLLPIGQAYANDGEDFEDALPRLAREYGVTEPEMRKILWWSLFNSTNAVASLTLAEQAAKKAAAEAQQIAETNVTDAGAKAAAAPPEAEAA